MKLHFAVFLWLSILAGMLPAQSDEIINWGNGPVAGTIDRDKNPPMYWLSLNIGLDQWEEGKRITYR